MLTKNIFNIHINIKKIISITLIILILSNLFNFLVNNEVQASYSTEFANYPGYEGLIKKLQEAHQNWEFEIIETGLEWSEVIIAETTATHGKNVVPQSWSGAWKCSCGKKVDETWRCASTAAVSYYMDPRNSLNEKSIFQFEQLTFDSANQTKEGVATILSDCNYMQGKITYYDTEGKKQTLEKTYVDVIMEIAKEYNISPYHLASRIRQEQGAGDAGAMISGNWTGKNGEYKGYYNYFNILAFGDTEEEVIASGLKNAKSKGWTDPEKSIRGGAEVLLNRYISYGHDTLYLQKFDVTDGGDGLYGWQYMTNVAASKSEAAQIYETYKEMGMINETSKIKFKIPVYKNMPEMISVEPGSETIVTESVKLKGDDVHVRNGKGTEYTSITKLSKDTIVLRIEQDNVADTNGRYWDKVVLDDGTTGYISREYLTKIDLQTNCNEQYIVSKYTNFRNGPGTSSTTILKLLSPGQIVTVVQKDKYKNINGENWYCIKLADETYGYVGAGYIEVYDATNSTTEQVKVVCTDGINIRKEPSTSSTVLKAVTQGTILTRTEKNVESADTKYIWDKVTTSTGTVGYVVRQDPETKKLWIEPVNGSTSGEENREPEEPKGPEENETEIKGTGFKSEGTILTTQPNITVANIKKAAASAVIKKGDTVIKDTENVGTGYTLTLGKEKYTIVVLGDVNGDGKVNTGDTLAMSQHIENYKKITNFNYLKAADANRDGKVNTGDSLMMRQHVENFKKITL